MDSQIPYFCGDSLECRTFGNPEALEQAKKNVEEKFVMVGTIDSLSKSHSVMECLMPDQMQGLAEIHKNSVQIVHMLHHMHQPFPYLLPLIYNCIVTSFT